MSTHQIEIDGSVGEGGGQILRSSLALSLLTGKPFRLRNIRARRKNPGLQPQHLMSVRAAAQIGQAEVIGASRGSSDLVFKPNTIVAGDYEFAIGTAGATSLVLHTVYLPLALRATEPSRIVIKGGTHVMMSPSSDFLITTWQGYMTQLGLKLSIALHRLGFYPKGAGEIEARVQPIAAVNSWNLTEKTEIKNVRVVGAVAGLPKDIAGRLVRRVTQRFKQFDANLKVQGEQQEWEGGPGVVLTLELQTQPVTTLFFGLGKRGKKAEQVADEVFDEAVTFLMCPYAVVDPHSADQLVLPLVFANGSSSYGVAEVTEHLTTNIAVIQKFVDRTIRCEGTVGKAGTVFVD
ncbi:MAG: RNA 3'-terminal phosphate cyclase [Gemmataceae bacterium]